MTKITDEMVEAACASHWPGPWPGDRTGLALEVKRNDMRSVLTAALAAAVQEGEAKPVAGVHEYVDGYELRCDNGDGYTPSDFEKSMIEDAINGYVGALSHPAPADAGVVEKAKAFLSAVVSLCDWLNGNDLSADHARLRPDDFGALSTAMTDLRAALRTKGGE